MSNFLEELKKWYLETRRNFPYCYDTFYVKSGGTAPFDKDIKIPFTEVEIIVGTIETLQDENTRLYEDYGNKDLLIAYMRKDLEQLKEEIKQLKEGE